jgi:hypothetical protein
MVQSLKVEEFEIHGVTFRRGDDIKVLPSAPRLRDGFLGRVINATLDASGDVKCVTVFGAPGTKAPSVRSLLPLRLAKPPKKRFSVRHDRREEAAHD